MQWSEQHPWSPDATFDGGDLDCGNGLLLLIRRHLDPLARGQLLEIRSTDTSVEEDLPAWSRLTGNELISQTRTGNQRSYLVSKGAFVPESKQTTPPVGSRNMEPRAPATPAHVPQTVPSIRPFSVMGIGSWPRPHWLLQAIHEHLEGRLDEQTFQQTADDAVRLAVAAQERAGVDVVTDGEQRRDSYASFVGGRLENCQLVPITDLLPYVEDPQEFEAELRALDVPASEVRHPAILGPLARVRPLAVHELDFVHTLTQKPIKIALPGPYLLTRTMWLECVTERVYQTREELACDIVRILREEIRDLLHAGAALVQLDEPVLTEVVFGQPARNRSFMCGALGQRRDTAEELALASRLLNEVAAGFPPERLAIHICRGNWSRDEKVALAGNYRPLLPLFHTLPFGTFFLEMCTPRAGELEVLRELPAYARLGLGVINQKLDVVESPQEIVARAERAVAIFGPERLLLNPDCGFATFADSPIASAQTAEQKLAAIVVAARQLRQQFGIAL